jgi:DNA-directed RNA polymerase subunit M/transcription elongation factor TFIIS
MKRIQIRAKPVVSQKPIAVEEIPLPPPQPKKSTPRAVVEKPAEHVHKPTLPPKSTEPIEIEQPAVVEQTPEKQNREPVQDEVKTFPFASWLKQWNYMYPKYVTTEWRTTMSQYCKEMMPDEEQWIVNLEQQSYELVFYDYEQYRDNIFRVIRNVQNNPLLFGYSIYQLLIMDNKLMTRGTEIEREQEEKELLKNMQAKVLQNENIFGAEEQGGYFHRCKQCKGSQVHFERRQIRSGDEPETLFIQCLNPLCSYRERQE